MIPLCEKAFLALLIGLLFISPPSIVAETAEENGLAIATEAARRHQGFGDYSVDMTMILRNRQGIESEWAISHKALEIVGDGIKSLSVIDSPQDVKGTAFLAFSRMTGNDEQYLYLPALKRTKRISSLNKSGSFMGSEFSYEDITSLGVGKYRYRHLREEVYRDKTCYVGESYPLDMKNSGYSKRILWVDKEEYRLLKVEFYDRKQSLLKTLTIDDYRQYPNGQWRAGKMEMLNHQTGKSTTLLWKNYRFRIGLTDENFNPIKLQLIKR